MNLLGRLISSQETLAKEIQLDEAEILKLWLDYADSLPVKKEIIDRLKIEPALVNNLQELDKLLMRELADIESEEKIDIDLLADLESVEHSRKLQKLQRLKDCLGYVDTKYEYVYDLLEHLHGALKSQMHLTEKLILSQKTPGRWMTAEQRMVIQKMISHIRMQSEIENDIVGKLNDMKTFSLVFRELIKGEHIIKKLSDVEKRLRKKLQKEFPQNGLVDNWVTGVNDGVMVKMDEALDAGILSGHTEADFEFVNKPAFVDLVKETINNLRVKSVSENMINAFVHLFREMYNEHR